LLTTNSLQHRRRAGRGDRCQVRRHQEAV
jgi:hypothetical protein